MIETGPVGAAESGVGLAPIHAARVCVHSPAARVSAQSETLERLIPINALLHSIHAGVVVGPDNVPPNLQRRHLGDASKWSDDYSWQDGVVWRAGA
jgi:hypothetical protein